MPEFFTLWNADGTWDWWQAVLYSTLLLAGNGVLFAVVWFLRKETILECGYRKARAKRVRQTLRQWPFKDRVLLRRLVSEATESSPMLSFSLFLNYVNLLLAALSLVGWLGAILTCGDGWAMILVSCGGLGSMFFSTMISFIPDLLWVPSERRRYGLKKKK